LLVDVRLVPADKGRFEVTLDGELLHSKAATGRHARPGEVKALVQERIGPPVLWAVGLPARHQSSRWPSRPSVSGGRTVAPSSA
jgi:predicted Rdx family selenoprotein